MSRVQFYFDEHMPRVVANQLIKRGIRVVLAAEANMLDKDDDSEHLPYALSIEAVLVTRDFPFANRAGQITNAGVVCWTGQQDDIGGMVKALSAFVEAHTSESVQNRVFWIK